VALPPAPGGGVAEAQEGDDADVDEVQARLLRHEDGERLFPDVSHAAILFILHGVAPHALPFERGLVVSMFRRAGHAGFDRARRLPQGICVRRPCFVVWNFGRGNGVDAQCGVFCCCAFFCESILGCLALRLKIHA